MLRLRCHVISTANYIHLSIVHFEPPWPPCFAMSLVLLPWNRGTYVVGAFEAAPEEAAVCGGDAEVLV